MKFKITLLHVFTLSVFSLFSQSKTQEVVLVGTMHTVPKIVKKSYKPMLRFAKKYNPQVILMETPMPNDNKSWEYLKNGWSDNYKKFYYLSDSLSKIFNIDAKKFALLSQKKYEELTSDDIEYLLQSYAVKRDNGNYDLLKYLKKHGLKGAKKPTRHEDGDLTYKLALYNNIKVTNVDDQQTNKEYHIAWNKCIKEGVKNGNNSINNALNKKDYNKAKLPAILRRLGKHTNKRETLHRLHNLSSFSYVKTKTPGCLDGNNYWNQRNARIAKNIGNQVLAMGKQKNILFIGASHIIGVEKELKERFPNLKVILVNEY